MIKNHYRILGIKPSVSREEVLEARNRLLKRYHPDLNRGNEEEAKEKTIDIILASEVLCNPLTRGEYDKIHNNVFGSPMYSGQGGDYGAEYREIIQCMVCGKKNVIFESRHYCIFCGAGIGKTPEPFTSAMLDDFFAPSETESVWSRPFIARLVMLAALMTAALFLFGISSDWAEQIMTSDDTETAALVAWGSFSICVFIIIIGSIISVSRR